MSTPTRRRSPKIARDTVLLTAGLVVVMHELFLGGVQERPQLLVLAAGMMGMPILMRRDEAKKDQRD